VDHAPAENLHVSEGDLKDAEFVDSCVAGKDLVLSSLGLRTSGFAIWNEVFDAEFLEKANTNIIQAMKKHSVSKIALVSAAGCRDSISKVSLIFRVIMNVSVLRYVYPYVEKQEEMYVQASQESGFDICLVRPPMLTAGPKTGNAKKVDDLFGNRKIARADVADWMVKECEKPGRFADATPLITDDSIA
jgi:putative NADH-flavin reductase